VAKGFRSESLEHYDNVGALGSNMFGGIGTPEILILLFLGFILFGANRLPELANALGRSKGEFQKGLTEATKINTEQQTIADLEAGGRTPDQVLIGRAKKVGIDHTGMTVDELKKKVQALEAMEESE